MAAAIERHPPLRERARRIQTAPGAGPLLAATLVACMPELGTLSSRQAASLTGVAPHPRQSGASRPRGRCQAGRAPVRAVLYMATLAAIRCKTSSLRAFYQRLRANGKPFKLAIVAAMRKFIVTLNTMLKHQQDWHHHPA
jgi:transposase